MCAALEEVTDPEWDRLVQTVDKLVEAESARAAREQRNSGIIKGLLLTTTAVFAFASWQFRQIAEQPPMNAENIRSLQEKIAANETRDQDHHNNGSLHMSFTDQVKVFMPRSELEIVLANLSNTDREMKASTQEDLRDLKSQLDRLDNKLAEILKRLP